MGREGFVGGEERGEGRSTGVATVAAAAAINTVAATCNAINTVAATCTTGEKKENPSPNAIASTPAASFTVGGVVLVCMLVKSERQRGRAGEEKSERERLRKREGEREVACV
jgi:uncharacterized membrane protein